MTTDTQEALAYLEQLQRHTYEHLGIEPDWATADYLEFQEAFIRRYYESQVRHRGTPFEVFREMALQELRGGPDTAISTYQDPAWYSLLVRMTKEIEEVLSGQNMKLDPAPLFGTLPTGRVNGMALKAPGLDHVIILIEDGLFGFANLAAKAVSRTFPFKGDSEGRLMFSVDPADWQQELAARPELPEKFLEVLLAYIVGGHPHLATSYLPEPNYDGIASALRDALELFVLGHEYGHLVSGHLNGDETKRAVIAGEDIDEITTNWNEEFEADVRGLEFMLAVMGKRGFDLSLSFWGAEFFFGCIEIVERAVSVIRTGEADIPLSTTHPPTEMRRQMLHLVLERSVPEESVIGPLQLAGRVSSVLEQLWRFCEPVLLDAHRKGVVLAPAWRQ
ncbi:hypothetical protein NJF44_09110 [Pseudomonas guariconensis]|uniref:hypothetical protein n=1 Tax=Pseudomonas TaxID=286 RepID=UPI001CE3D432|nr:MULTISPECIES: hypothetical protein [Pseudomonas]MCO7513808.1 hypothetical protein [Pseudomonas putida]MCO7595507.1 hypothetical protein [Pseudomonas guariconensis]MCO7605389.1 hypothetical protein [Pseudomonas guariconensis]MCU7220515.1 hypothetical protein [Pseudomonas brassicacearum]